jgi:bacterioferritin (cytochrome b1)
MQGDERVVRKLDELLCDELTAIMQYVGRRSPPGRFTT